MQNKIYCDLGEKTERRVFEALRRLKNYATLDKVAPSDDGRFAAIISDPKADIFDSDDGYSAEHLRRLRTHRYIKNVDGKLSAVAPPASTEDDGLTPTYDDATITNCRSLMEFGFVLTLSLSSVWAHFKFPVLPFFAQVQVFVRKLQLLLPSEQKEDAI